MIWFIDFNRIFFLLFIYLINANVNHEKLIDEFLNPFITLTFQEDPFSFLGFFFFFGKPNEDRFIFNNHSFVQLIIKRFLGKKYNEIFIDFNY